MSCCPRAFGRFRLLGLGLVLVVLVGWAVRGSRADLGGPTAEDRQVTVSVTSLLRSQHLSQHPLDDEMSQRFLRTFLKMLDPKKVFFYQSDIDSFMTRQSDLDDDVKKGNIEFAYTVFKTFLARVDERVKLVDELLAADPDFTADEEMLTDADLVQYPRDVAEARETWRQQIKYEWLELKAGGEGQASKEAGEEQPDASDAEDPRGRLARRYHSFGRRMHQTDEHELLEMYLTSLTTSYDPHSTYMSASTLENFEIIMRLNLEGIGASLQSDDGYTLVRELIAGGAADKDGRLKPEDRIVGVGQGEDGPMVDVVDMKLEDVVQLIRGKRGTVVRIEVVPAGQAERKIYNITRDRIELVDSEARGKIIEDARDGQTFRIGVIDLPSFYMDMEAARLGLRDFKSTTRDVARLLEGFRSQKVDAVILDLRRNGGGSLPEAISLTGLFIDEGPIVQVKDKDDRVEPYDDMERGTAWDGPLVVLTSKFSASASEIFAGAIQDYGRGVIVGDKATHGKGTVQSLRDLGRELFRGTPNPPRLGALKVTMQQFYRPNGDSTQNRGVSADIELPSLTAHYDVGEADLDHALQFDRIDAMPYRKVHLVDRDVVDRLNTLSSQRCKNSTEFQKVLRDIERYNQRKSRKVVTLNEAKFLAERAEWNAEKEEDRQNQDQNKAGRPVFDTESFYNREALAITLDYLALRQVAAN